MIEFFRKDLVENFRGLQFGLEFLSFEEQNRNPRVCRENWAIVEKVRDWQILSHYFSLPKKTKACSQKILQFNGG